MPHFSEPWRLYGLYSAESLGQSGFYKPHRLATLALSSLARLSVGKCPKSRSMPLSEFGQVELG